MTNKEISYEYIRGLIEGEGCFSFCSSGYGLNKLIIPTFILAMSKRDEHLINLVKNKLKIENKTYEYNQKDLKFADGKISKRQPIVRFMVRGIGHIKNIIVPLCYKKLHGNKGIQFEKWIEKMGSDPRVPKSYKFIHKLYEIGFYEKIDFYN